VRVTRNTVLQTGRAVMVYGSSHGPEAPGFVFTGNVIRHNRYGLFGNSVGTGNPAIERYLPGAVVENNLFFGGERRLYPAGNRFEGADAFEGLIVEAVGGYRLREAGALGRSGADLTALRTSGRVEPGGRQPRKD
jgi:hypothetical protein